MKGVGQNMPPGLESLLKKVQINLPFHLLLEQLDRVLEFGLQPEIYFSAAALDRLSPGEVKKTSKALAREDIPVTFHGPFMDLNPGAVDEKIRGVTVYRFEQVLALVPHFRPQTIVFHPGYDRWRYDGNMELWLEKSLLTWKPLVQKAESLSVKFALENVFDDHPGPLENLLSSLDSPFAGYCLDAGHGNLFFRGPVTRWLEVLGPRLIEIHLHDNKRQADEHLPLGEGDIDFPALFSFLRENNLQPILTLEPHLAEHLEPSLRALEKYL